MMDSNYLTDEDVALRWGVTKITLGQWRWSGSGPAFTKIGKRIFYHINDVHTFEQTRVFQNTSQLKKQKLLVLEKLSGRNS